MTRSIAPFLSMRMSRAEVRHLHLAGADDRFDGGGEKERRERRQPPGASFLTMRTSMPPSAPRRSVTSSMKLRMKKMPRPLDLRMFSGASGSATSSGSKPSPWSSTRTTSSLGSATGAKVNSTVTSLSESSRLPCLMALMTDSRTATPTQWTASSSRPAELGHAVADHLHEVQHVEVAVDLEPDRAAACQHAGAATPAPRGPDAAETMESAGSEAHASE